MQYSLDQYALLPCPVSPIEHRADIQVKDDQGKYRLFVAPMTCILNKGNFNTFLNSSFIPIYPIWHGESLTDRLNLAASKDCWVALSLNEFCDFFCSKYSSAIPDPTKGFKVLIDCANGHMSRVFDAVKEAKSRHKNLTIMTGNIAHPDAYIECCKAGIDYVRVGIGGGSGCTSSVKLGFHASMGWLLTEIQAQKKTLLNYTYTAMSFEEVCEDRGWTCTKIIADGGCDSSDRIIKCLALGADYIMCGKLFAQSKEACAESKEMYCRQRYIPLKGNYATDTEERTVIEDIPGTGVVSRKYYGQASEQGKQDRFGKCEGHVEGTSLWVPIKYSLGGLDQELGDCFSSALSYGGARTWDEFIGKVQWDIQSNSEFNAYNK